MKEKAYSTFSYTFSCPLHVLLIVSRTITCPYTCNELKITIYAPMIYSIWPCA
jgi:hypothetical protein